MSKLFKSFFNFNNESNIKMSWIGYPVYEEGPVKVTSYCEFRFFRGSRKTMILESALLNSERSV